MEYSNTSKQPESGSTRVAQRGTSGVAEFGRLQLNMPLFVEELRMNMGLDGDSQPILDLIARVHALSRTHAPVIFIGQPGVGKKKFALFLHRMATSSEIGCLFLSCDSIVKNGPSCFQVDTYLENVEAFNQQTVIIDRPELLPKGLCQELLSKFLIRAPISHPRPIITIDIQAFPKLLMSCGPKLKPILQNGIVHVPSLRERRSDVQKHILAKVRALNQAHGMTKRISVGALEQLATREYPQNFHSLYAVIEKLYAAQDDINFDEKIVDEELRNANANALLPELFAGFSMEEFLGNLRQKIIWHALERSDYNQSRCAELLGVSPQAINKFLRAQGLSRKQMRRVWPMN
jgi:transcriptional regulator of acetoin/glycerol metabolism